MYLRYTHLCRVTRLRLDINLQRCMVLRCTGPNPTRVNPQKVDMDIQKREAGETHIPNRRTRLGKVYSIQGS